MNFKTRLKILALTLSILVVAAIIAAHQELGSFPVASLKLYSSALAQTNQPVLPEPVTLTDEQQEYPLGLHLEILEDASGELTIDEVSSPEFDSQFTPSQAEVPNYGFTDSAYWVRFRLDNETSQAAERLLEVGFANMHFVDLYSPLPGDQGFDVKQTGALRPVSTRDVLHPNIVFDLVVPAQSQQTYYLRFQNGASMTLPLILWAQSAFFSKAQQEQMLNWLFFGAIMALLVYHLFLLFTVKETSYLFFVILLASLLIEELSYTGYLEAHLLPNLYSLKPIYYPLSFSFMIASIVLFSDAFLELKTRLLKLHWANIVILAVWGGLMLLVPFLGYHNNAVLMIPWSLVSLVTTWVAGIAVWRKGFYPSRFFLIAWLGMLVSLFLVILVRLGIAPSTLFNENLYRLGLLWVAVCWSIALADRINLLKAETESANRHLKHSEHQLNQILEDMPLGVVLYGKDHKPRYINQRAVELLTNPAQGIRPDLSAGRTLAQAIPYFSLRMAGSSQEYPLENIPVYRALQGETASADNIEMDRGDECVSLEFWANPIFDEVGEVESAVLAFQDITQRKKAESELVEYRNHLEALVENRTVELNEVNEQLRLRLEWLSAIVLVNQMMARSSEFTQIYEKIIEIINRLFSIRDSFIAELDEGSGQFKILAHSCRNGHQELTGLLIVLPTGIVTDVNLKEEKPVFISMDQLSLMSGPISIHFQVSNIHGITLVPLQLHEQLLGFLGLEVHEVGRLITDEEIDLLRIFSIDIAQLIEDSHLHEQTRALIMAEERNRLARDLHDSVTQVLFSITLLADIIPRIWRRDPEQGLQRLEKLQRLARGALAEMRTMLIELRPSAIINNPLGDLMAQLTEAVASRSDLKFLLAIEQIPPLPGNVQTSFYRIAQEALNNVVKHAQAKQVTVSLSMNPPPHDTNGQQLQELKLVIQDDGVGFDIRNERSTHLGIGIMHERAAAIQATLSLDSIPGYGTTVSLIWCKKSENQ
jgi:signal transduction histidine kinase